MQERSGSGEATILIIDDDPALQRVVSYSLQEAGYTVLTADDGREGLRIFYEDHPNLLILDVEMPHMDGWTMCQRVREVSDVPIIMLTASKDLDSIVKGLDLGADDYMAKPCQVRELIARVQANLRRAATPPAVAIKEAVIYSDKWLTVNVEERRILVDGEAVRLTPTEFNLLAKLVAASPRVMTYRDLLEQVWGWEYIDDIDYLRVYVWHLRRKLEPEPKEPIYIINVMGVGYRFEPQV